ncbi:MAG: MBL fold metallo-hydrolase [Proteobacteria bacterium]|nr:MBL fold metallo-hydrolase [Pseudomonadota bacterium]
MHITMLGTGNALVTKCYNTCFVIRDGNAQMLIDGGGGSQLLAQLECAGIDCNDIHDIFVTHKHIDHLMGIVWIIRIIAQSMNKNIYRDDLNVFAHAELINTIRELCFMLLQSKQTRHIGERIHLIPVYDLEKRVILNHEFTFFDIHSTKATQFGFSMILNDGNKLTCCGDEPCSPEVEDIVWNSEWLMHEAFCLHSEADKYRPYEKNHSTVKDACELAERLHVRNLIIYHTEDDNLRMRKVLYHAEGSRYYSGNLLIPNDLETIKLTEVSD